MPEVIFNGPEGRLEGRFHQAKGETPPIALLLHPHPQHGGTMNNRVVFQLFRSFTQRGFSALRFNFRGVGRSQGSFDDGLGEFSDAAAALDWVQAHNPDAPECWVAGFSFGARLGLRLLTKQRAGTGFIAVAPPVKNLDFSFLTSWPAAGLIVHGTNDTLVPLEGLRKWIEKLQGAHPVRFQPIEDASHFFEDHLAVLANVIHDYLDSLDHPREFPSDPVNG